MCAGTLSWKQIPTLLAFVWVRFFFCKPFWIWFSDFLHVGLVGTKSWGGAYRLSYPVACLPALLYYLYLWATSWTMRKTAKEIGSTASFPVRLIAWSSSQLPKRGRSSGFPLLNEFLLASAISNCSRAWPVYSLDCYKSAHYRSITSRCWLA